MIPVHILFVDLRLGCFLIDQSDNTPQFFYLLRISVVRPLIPLQLLLQSIMLLVSGFCF